MILRKMFAPSIFIRLFLSFLLVILPLFYLGLEMYKRATTIVMAEISNSMGSQVHFYMNSLEKEITRNMKNKRQFLNDNDLFRLSITGASISEYEKSLFIKRLVEKMDLLKESSLYIQNMSLHIPALERTITIQEWAEPIPTEKFEALRKLYVQTVSPFIVWNDKLYMVEMFPNPPISPERKPVFLLDIEINQTELKHYLVQLMTYENGGSALLHGDWSLSNNIDERSFETIRQEIDRSFSVHNETSAIRSITVDDRRYFAVYEYSAVLDSTLLVYIPEGSVLGPLLKLRVLFLTLAAAALFIVTFFSYRIYRVIHIPLSKLVRAFGKVMTGNLLVSVRHGRKDEFHYLYEQFNQMVERIRLLIHEVYEQKIRVQRSELKQLQSQISPHFLYNSFYMIHRMSTISDMDGIKRFTKYLSDYFQFITRSGNDELTLEQEVRHAQAYVEIQRFRFYNRIQVEFGELPEAIGGITVPRLIIQPLVENSYKYALESHTGEGRLRISFLVELDRLHVLVEDNGEHLTDLKLQERKELLRSRNRDLEEVTALINIQRRIQIRFGEDWGLTLSRSEWGGMSVQLAIPIEQPIEQPKEEPDVSLDDNR